MPHHDLLVIGAGPGGYVAAIRAAQLGLKTACVELEGALGGTCLRIGCIPSKAMLEASELYQLAKGHLGGYGIKTSGVELDLPAMLKRKDDVVSTLTKGIDGLFRKNKVTRYLGHASFTGPKTVVVKGAEQTEVTADRFIIATGSKSAALRGVELDYKNVVTSTEALSFDRVPEHLVVIGAGVIGLELGCVWARLGAKVTVLEYLDRILPGMDTDIASDAQKVFVKQGLNFQLGRKVTAARFDGQTCVVEVEGQPPIQCDKVLLAVGRVPNTDGLNLAAAGVQLDNRGRVIVHEFFKTSADGIYAIGDVIAGPMLAHKAEEEGVAVAEGIVSGHCHINYDAIPAVVYTDPEVASVGKSEDQLKTDGVPYKVGVFPFLANGRARAIGQTDGRVKMLAHAETDRVLGVHIIGPHAGDLIAEAAAAIEFGASSEDIARTSHAHPTLAEAIKEAALAVDRRPIHI